MTRYSKAMKLFPVLIIMPLIQVRPELAPALRWQPRGALPFAVRWDICRPLQHQGVCPATCWAQQSKGGAAFQHFNLPACLLPCLPRLPRCLFPAPQIVWVLFSMISGSLYYQEYKTLNALSGSMFALGVVVLLAGVWLLTGGKPPAPPVSPAAGPVLLQWALLLLGSVLRRAAGVPAAPSAPPEPACAHTLLPLRTSLFFFFFCSRVSSRWSCLSCRKRRGRAWRSSTSWRCAARRP